jgi:transposase
LAIKDDVRGRLLRLARSGKTPQRVARRARLVLMGADGISNSEAARIVGVSRPTVLLWRGRFERLGVAGLLRDAPRPGRKKRLTSELVQRIVEETQQTKPKAATHWSTRAMAKRHRVSHMTVQRIWQQYRLRPHLLQRFQLSNDPKLVEKVRDVVGLYLDPPDKALVLSVDEKSQIQALDRTAPVLPLRPGIPERQTHDYRRYGTTTLFAALNMLDGKVIGECRPRHRSDDFLAFLRQIERATPSALDLHLIVDNYGTHKSKLVRDWLMHHRRFHLHFTPTGSSWLNMVERWLGELTEKRVRRGTFRSVAELVRAIREYLDNYNKSPRIFVWTKDADMILGKIARCKEALVTPH